jgi:glucose/arabinose dehydrogenase
VSGRVLTAANAVSYRRALVALVALGAILVAAASASAAPKATVFAKAIDNPRGLALGPDGTLYVASAGHAGPTCLDKKKENCIGLTSRVLAYSPAGAKRVVAKGLLSGAGGDGSFAAGADGVAIGPDGHIYTVTTSGTPKDIGAAPKKFAAGAGKLFDVTLGSLNPIAAIDAFEWAHNSDGVKGDRNSNPYAVLALADRRIVADAGANAILSVDAAGTVSLLAVIPKNGKEQAVPTSLALGPDGAVYVGELALGAGKNKARIWRVALDGTPPTVFARGFTTITGLAFAPDGSLYVSELTLDPARLGPKGAIVHRRADGSVTTYKKSIAYPAGVAVAPDGSLYVSNNSILPAHTPKKSPFRGHGGEIRKITGF